MQLETRLESWGERLLGLGARLEATLPVRCEAWCHSLGECTAFDGYTVGLKCQLLKSRLDKTDFLVLEIQVRSLSSEPVVEKAELAWNDFMAQPFKSPLRKPRSVSESLLNELDAFFPKWESMLRRAVVEGVKQRTGAIVGMIRCVEETQREPEEADPIEFQVIQECFRELFGPLEGEPLLLSPEMLLPAVLSDPARILPGTQEATFLDFCRRNNSRTVLPEGFQLGGRSTTLLESIFSETHSDLRHIYRRFPRTPGHFSFSRPGLNLARNQALMVATRHDGLHSKSRSQDDPILSSWFSGLCLLELEQGRWRLKGFANWMQLVDNSGQYEAAKARVAQRMESELAEGGWEICESQGERMRLRNAVGAFVTIVTGSFLRDQLITRMDETPERDFFISEDPVLIVTHLEARQILDGLK